MKLMNCFSFRFTYYVVVRNLRSPWMRVAAKDWTKLVNNMHWRKHFEEYSYAKR